MKILEIDKLAPHGVLTHFHRPVEFTVDVATLEFTITVGSFLSLAAAQDVDVVPVGKHVVTGALESWGPTTPSLAVDIVRLHPDWSGATVVEEP